jgi:hypothetical protein
VDISKFYFGPFFTLFSCSTPLSRKLGNPETLHRGHLKHYREDTINITERTPEHYREDTINITKRTPEHYREDTINITKRTPEHYREDTINITQKTQ